MQGQPCKVCRGSEERDQDSHLYRRDQDSSLNHKHHYLGDQTLGSLKAAPLVSEEDTHCDGCEDVGECVEALRKPEEDLFWNR